MGNGEIILYTAEDGSAVIQLRADEGTVWLTRTEIADLFQTTPQNITLHIQGVCEEEEVDLGSTSKDYLLVQTEGERSVERKVKLYNLNMILAIGYRVRSSRGTQFRKWATTHLQEYLVKGFVMDDAILKEPKPWDYFDEWLERASRSCGESYSANKFSVLGNIDKVCKCPFIDFFNISFPILGLQEDWLKN